MKSVRLKISKRKILMAFVDGLFAFLSLWVAFFIKYDYSDHNDHIGEFFNSPEIIAFMILLSLAVFYLCGFYDHIWRYASINQYLILFGGTLIQGVLIASMLNWRGFVFPGSVFIIYWMIIFLSVTGIRIIYRLLMNRVYKKTNIYRYYGRRYRQRHSEQEHPDNYNQQAGDQKMDEDIGSADNMYAENKIEMIRIMIVGVGYAGSQIIRELQEHPGNRIPVAAIDDNPDKHSFKIRGVPVIGDRNQIISVAKEYRVDEIVIAIPSASNHEIKEIIDICARTGCELKQVPLLSDLIDGRVSISDIRNVDIADLLGRDQVVLDNCEISKTLENQVILITGGGGSIGSEICRQVAAFKPKLLIVFDIYENNAYELQQQLLSKYKNLNLLVLIGSVRDRTRLERIFAEYQPSVVFHAAAHKHVPLMEDSPGEAVKNNVFGTYNAALTAARNKVKRFVLISTDKAVNPTNVMGASKRLAEMVIQHMACEFSETRFAAVRFGNVLGSNGSVIPLFKRQIKEEGCVKVTHPEITRYFMTIPEASRLVIQAGVFADGGEIFVLDMGKPVKILDLAKDLIRLSGLEPEVDIPIVYTGLRPGEKMYEELYLDEETMDKTKNEKIFVLKPISDITKIENEINQLKSIIGWRHMEFDKLLHRLKFQCTSNVKVAKTEKEEL